MTEDEREQRIRDFLEEYIVSARSGEKKRSEAEKLKELGF